MKRIQLFAMDVDGTLTDGKIYMSASGELMKAFHVKDGQGILLLEQNGIVPVIITARKSAIVQNRANELGIKEVFQGTRGKLAVLKELCKKYDVTPDEIAYIGDDIVDLEAIRFCGFSFCPADAVSEVRETVDCVLTANGGEGAVREASEYILRKQ